MKNPAIEALLARHRAADPMAPKTCPWCKGSAPVYADSPKHRLYECADCGADYLISKGASSWWYHGWEHVDGRQMIPEVVGTSRDTRPSHVAPHHRRKFFEEGRP